MLILHIRFVDMGICAFMKVETLPVAWFVVGVLLLVLLLVVTVLLVLKIREVTSLKEEVLELRDTMRMMRYEEANLARMLHRASEPVEPVVDSTEIEGEEHSMFTQQKENQFAEVSLVEPEGLHERLVEVQSADQETPQGNVPQVKVLEKVVETVDGGGVEDILMSETKDSVVPQSHKHAINERRPAIPNDLFAAWFAENEDLPSEEQRSIDVKPAITVSSMAVAHEKDEEVVSCLSEKIEPQIQNTPMHSDMEEKIVPQDDISLSPDFTNQGVQVLNKEDERFCRKLDRLVNARLRNPNLNIDIIAAQFGIGRTNFYRKVRELTGMSPNDFLRKCRMERAAELLSSTEVAVSEVCAQVGIPDAQYFSRVFKAHFGVSPSAYRESNNQ